MNAMPSTPTGARHALSAPLAQWLRNTVGPFEILPSPHGRQTRHETIHIRAEGVDAYVKLHQQRERWASEVFAYRHWITDAPSAFPELLGVLDGPDQYGIVTRALPGLPVEDVEMLASDLSRVWFEAGRLAARIAHVKVGEWFGAVDENGAPAGESSQDPIACAANWVEGWVRRARNMKALEHGETELAERALAACDCFAGERPHPVNPDSTPGNWIVDAQGVLLGIVDLEEMHWGLELAAFPHLVTKFAVGRSECLSAFLSGYGVPILDKKPVQFWVLCVALGLATVVYGQEQDSAKHVARGRDILKAQCRDGA